MSNDAIKNLKELQNRYDALCKECDKISHISLDAEDFDALREKLSERVIIFSRDMVKEQILSEIRVIESEMHKIICDYDYNIERIIRRRVCSLIESIAHRYIGNVDELTREVKDDINKRTIDAFTDIMRILKNE